jgi:Spy/CpxP family protein refolding chaperone
MRGHMWGRHAHGESMGEGGQKGGGCGCGGGPHRSHDHERGEGAGAVFGVRRPLRFLAHKLELDDAQAAQLARFLDELRIEHEQAAVDSRRATGALADAVEGETLDAAKLAHAAGVRVQSAERLRDAVVQAVTHIHALLAPAQRQRLAFLIRSGALEL